MKILKSLFLIGISFMFMGCPPLVHNRESNHSEIFYIVNNSNTDLQNINIGERYDIYSNEEYTEKRYDEVNLFYKKLSIGRFNVLYLRDEPKHRKNRKIMLNDSTELKKWDYIDFGGNNYDEYASRNRYYCDTTNSDYLFCRDNWEFEYKERDDGEYREYIYTYTITQEMVDRWKKEKGIE